MHDMRFCNMSYQGVIKKIEWDEKKFPTLYFNDKTEYLSYYDRDSLCEIFVGDSIVKRSGDMNYRIYRKNNSGKWIFSFQTRPMLIFGF